MTTITIQNPILTLNPFVEKTTEALEDRYCNPYPDVIYDYDGNEVQIDGEYFTLDPDVQAYLEDIDRQIDEVPIREVSVETRSLEIVDADDRPENEGLSSSDEGYQHNGLIRFHAETTNRVSYAVKRYRRKWGVFLIDATTGEDGRLVSTHKTSREADAVCMRLVFG